MSRQDGLATRERIIDTAEALFAIEGVNGVSIRSVNAAAGLAPAGVHYHFGSKDALLDEVIRRRGDLVAKELVVRVEELLARRRPPPTIELVRAFALPMVAVLQSDPVGGRYWLCVLAQLMGSHDERLAGYTGAHNPGERATSLVFEALERTYPDADPGLRALEWHIGTMVIVQMLSEFGLPRERPWMSGPAALDRYAEVVINFVAAGLAGSLNATSARPR